MPWKVGSIGALGLSIYAGDCLGASIYPGATYGI